VYHDQARRLGLILFPIGAMSLVYPLPPAELDGLAYFFSTELGAGPLRYVQNLTGEMTRNPGIQAIAGAVRAWRAAYAGGKQPALTMQDHGDQVLITDTRGCAREPRHVLAGLAREVYLACDRAPRRAKLVQTVLARTPAATGDQVADVAGRLIADRLVLELDGRLIALALPASGGPGGPGAPDYTQFPGGHVFAGRPDAESR
jgi:magnesium-protoporphyrin IX monomethyl ester (oxidative) cyclase